MTTPSTEQEARRFAEGRLHTLVAVLLSHGVTCMPVRAQLLPRRLSMLVSLSHGESIAKVRAKARDIAMALEVDHAEVGHASGHVSVTVPLPAEFWRYPQFGKLLFTIRQSTRPVGGLPVVLGLEDNGQVLAADLSSARTPHLLVGGTTGSGKTNLLRSMLASLVLLSPPSRVQLVVIDVKEYEFGTFDTVPHLLFPVVTEPKDWPAAIGHVVLKMRERRQSAGPDRPIMPRLVLVIDEIATVLETYAGLEPSLKELTATGRAEGCHAILATQKPSAAALSTLITSNLPARIAGGCVNATDARLITGHAQSGAEKLPGLGTFLLVTEGGRTRPFTAPLVEERDLPALLADVQATVGHPDLHTGKVVDFVAALEERRTAGRPPKEIRQEVIDWLVGELAKGRTPSQRAIQREIARVEGSGADLANRQRAEEALRLAQEQVA